MDLAPHRSLGRVLGIRHALVVAHHEVDLDPDLGDRAGFFVIDMLEASQVAEVAERFFFGLNAEVEMTPVMSVEDLQKGLSGIETIIKNYG